MGANTCDRRCKIMERNYKCLVCCISVNDHNKRRLLNPEMSANRAVGLFFREHISRTYKFSWPEYTCTPCFRKLEGALRAWSNYQSAVTTSEANFLEDWVQVYLKCPSKDLLWMRALKQMKRMLQLVEKEMQPQFYSHLQREEKPSCNQLEARLSLLPKLLL